MVGVALLGNSRAAIASLSGRQSAGQGGMVIGGVAGVGKGAAQVLPLRPSRCILLATYRTARQMPVEDRAGLSPTQGRTRSGSLRRPQLARVAPSCDGGHGLARFPFSGNLTR